MTTGYNLKWEKFGENIAQSYKQLRLQDDFHDVTLVSDDLQKVSAHKLVLSACSQYFKTILTDSKHQHPMLCLDGIDSQQLNNVLDYIYNGEIEISHEHLRKFLQIAQKLKLDGLIPEDFSEIGEKSVQAEKFLDENYKEDQSPNNDYTVTVEEVMKKRKKCQNLTEEKSALKAVKKEEKVIFNQEQEKEFNIKKIQEKDTGRNDEKAHNNFDKTIEETSLNVKGNEVKTRNEKKVPQLPKVSKSKPSEEKIKNTEIQKSNQEIFRPKYFFSASLGF